MDYIEELARRKDFIARLRERMMPMLDNYDRITNTYDPKDVIQFGSTASDYELLQDLFDALMRDCILLEVEHLKVSPNVSIEKG
jgi:hypothetical protein